jgi:hypothetical protein
MKPSEHQATTVNMFPELGGSWEIVPDGDLNAFEIFQRHYSYRPYRDGRRERYGYRNRKQFVGPGEKMVLISTDRKVLFVWRRFQSRGENAQGVNCAVFRNEGHRRSSLLILEAETLAWQRWPGARLYTYVNPKAVRSQNPGFCFQRAGWVKCGETRVNRLLIFEKFPE